MMIEIVGERRNKKGELCVTATAKCPGCETTFVESCGPEKVTIATLQARLAMHERFCDDRLSAIDPRPSYLRDEN